MNTGIIVTIIGATLFGFLFLVDRICTCIEKINNPENINKLTDKEEK